MDPWLERPSVFPDFHDRLIAAMGAAINALLPPPFYSAIANRVWVEGPDRYIEPDVDVLRPEGNGQLKSPNGGGVATAIADSVRVQPVIIRVPSEEVIERYLEIHSAPDGERLVTTIEVLSLTNKRLGSEGRKEYRKKQREMLQSDVNLVEIDLLRGGSHTTCVALDRAIQKTGPFDYHVCVHRFDKPEEFEVYPIRLPQQLPEIAIPLVPGTSDIVVNLQDLLSQCYDVGLYSRRIRYQEHRPEPPLSEDQAKWAEYILRDKGLLK